MRKGITPIIAIILLLLVTISIAGFALIFFQRTTETASQYTETELEQQTSAMSQNFVIEGADNNQVYIRNLGTGELTNLNFYVNNVRVDSSGTVPAGQVGTITLNDAQLAQHPNDANLRVTSLGASRDESVQFYKDEVVGYWKFDEADRTNVKDYSGNGNDGTFYIGSEGWRDGDLKPACPDCPVQTTGMYGNALSFDGVNDYVDAGNDASLDITSMITIEAWIRPNTLGTWRRVLQKCNVAGARNSYCIVLKDGTENIRWEVFNGGTQRYVDSNLTLPVDKWTHIAVTYDGQIMKIYLNGTLDNSNDYGSTMNIGTNTLNLYIGSSVDDPRYFDGTIDEVRIYNKALSQQEIEEDMNSAYPSARTVASYSFEKIENGKVLDTHNIVKGRYGAAMSFDGVDDYVDAGNSASLAVTSAVTAEAWVKPSSLAGYTNAIMGGNYKGYLLRVSQGGNARLTPHVYTNTYYAGSGATAIPLNQWTHVAMIYDGTTVKGYVNGVEDVSFTPAVGGGMVASTTGTQIGKEVGVGEGYFKGTIDEVRILNVARPMS